MVVGGGGVNLLSRCKSEQPVCDSQKDGALRLQIKKKKKKRERKNKWKQRVNDFFMAASLPDLA